MILINNCILNSSEWRMILVEVDKVVVVTKGTKITYKFNEQLTEKEQKELAFIISCELQSRSMTNISNTVNRYLIAKAKRQNKKQ